MTAGTCGCGDGKTTQPAGRGNALVPGSHTLYTTFRKLTVTQRTGAVRPVFDLSKKQWGGGSFRAKGPKPEACMQQAQAPLLTSTAQFLQGRKQGRKRKGSVLGKGAASPLPISYKPWPPRVFLEHYKAQETRINEWYITSRPILVKPTHPDQYFQ